ncbi:hypothetical protein C5167_024991 [Papaver somniferum]|uniref:Secreted protein n=1 Tax=Papaver somniferum TaxID=3469 RepID=A0A4Y7JTY3_PAPSO|nr:hypothetical protein C5167_024991 [Papaver somniferum]
MLVTMLRLVGKLALLWGGLRDAMILTDKLSSYTFQERPLPQSYCIAAAALDSSTSSNSASNVKATDYVSPVFVG